MRRKPVRRDGPGGSARVPFLRWAVPTTLSDVGFRFARMIHGTGISEHRVESKPDALARVTRWIVLAYASGSDRLMNHPGQRR
jgi:hypothetical protein